MEALAKIQFDQPDGHHHSNSKSFVNRHELHNASDCLLRTYWNDFSHAHSQHGEEYLLLPTLLAAAHGQPGTFVELGALDGVSLSNTVVLDKCFHWSGLLIEANPSSYAKLQRNGRNATKVHSAICGGHNDSATVRFTSGGGPVAGQLDQLSERHQAEWAKMNHPERNVEVRCRPLSSIMSSSALPQATFLSLDVEGAEATVLATVRPSAFKVIMVELDGSDQAKDTLAEQIILRDGLRYAPELPVSGSRVYLRKDVAAFPLPPQIMTRTIRFANRFAPARNVTAEALAHFLMQGAPRGS